MHVSVRGQLIRLLQVIQISLTCLLEGCPANLSVYFIPPFIASTCLCLLKKVDWLYNLYTWLKADYIDARLLYVTVWHCQTRISFDEQKCGM